jgi:hypothetical protein
MRVGLPNNRVWNVDAEPEEVLERFQRGDFPRDDDAGFDVEKLPRFEMLDPLIDFDGTSWVLYAGDEAYTFEPDRREAPPENPVPHTSPLRDLVLDLGWSTEQIVLSGSSIERLAVPVGADLSAVAALFGFPGIVDLQWAEVPDALLPLLLEETRPSLQVLEVRGSVSAEQVRAMAERTPDLFRLQATGDVAAWPAIETVIAGRLPDGPAPKEVRFTRTLDATHWAASTEHGPTSRPANAEAAMKALANVRPVALDLRVEQLSAHVPALCRVDLSLCTTLDARGTDLSARDVLALRERLPSDATFLRGEDLSERASWLPPARWNRLPHGWTAEEEHRLVQHWARHLAALLDHVGHRSASMHALAQEPAAPLQAIAAALPRRFDRGPRPVRDLLATARHRTLDIGVATGDWRTLSVGQARAVASLTEGTVRAWAGDGHDAPVWGRATPA